MNKTPIFKAIGRLVAGVQTQLEEKIAALHQEFEDQDKTIQEIADTSVNITNWVSEEIERLKEITIEDQDRIGQVTRNTAELHIAVNELTQQQSKSHSEFEQEIRSQLESIVDTAIEFRNEVSEQLIKDTDRIEELLNERASEAIAHTAEACSTVGDLIVTVSKLVADVQAIEVKDGIDGVDGRDGLDGERGEPGERGERGEKGDQGERGEPGQPGTDGRDGIDRPLTDPVDLVQGKKYAKNTVGCYNGGLWIAHKHAVGNPADDPHAWTCLLDGYTSLEVKQNPHEPKSFTAEFRMSSGKTLSATFDIPYIQMEHMGIWNEEKVYLPGNIVTKGSSFWQATEVTDKAPPGNGWRQILRSPNGKQGIPGENGKDGRDGVDGKDGKDGAQGPQGVPGRNGKDAEVDQEYLDMLLALATKAGQDDEREDAIPIKAHRGQFDFEKDYQRGDTVTSMNGWYLCLRDGKYNTVDDPDSWTMLAGG